MVALSPSTDERGSSLVYTLVVVVVLTIAVVSLLQLAAMSFKTGKFEEERQQALAAAESGIAVASVRLVSNDPMPTSAYPSSVPSIDSTAANWIGPGTGPIPKELLLGDNVSYRVWVSPPVDGRFTVVSEGRCGGRTRVIQQAFSSSTTGLPFLMSATSTQLFSIILNGSGSLDGDLHTEGKDAWSVVANLSTPANGTLYVRPDADIKGIRSKVGTYFRSVEVDPNTYRYPVPVCPAGLEYRGRFRANGWQPIVITKSGEYDEFIVNGSCEMTVDASQSDVIIHTKEDFIINGSVNLKIIGDHALKLYVDGNFTWNGSRGGAPPLDPTKFVIYCTGPKNPRSFPPNVTMNGFPNMAAVIYAPRADVVFNGEGEFSGAIVGSSITYNGSGRLAFPTGVYADKLKSINLGEVDGPPRSVPGSWRELPPLGKDKMKSD
ncbi:MAG TPA: hypothetical protein PLM83_08090 [Bacillota bacterium]|nr:hypothetical protein [Bacillota bacterium]